MVILLSRIPIFGTDYPMSTQFKEVSDKITQGVRLAAKRLIERTQKVDGELVISRDGKIIRIKARELKPGNHA